MKNLRFLALLGACIVLTLSCTEAGAGAAGKVDTFGLQPADGVIPYVVNNGGFMLYPDGYGKLTYVTYYPMNISGEGNLAWAMNSDNKAYGNLVWTFDRVSDLQGTLKFVYPYGDYEIYDLYQLKPPSGYRGAYYYKYEGHSGGQKVTYDGSFDIDTELGKTHGLVLIRSKSISPASSVKLTLDGSALVTLYSNQFYVKKVLCGDHPYTYQWTGSGIDTSVNSETVTVKANNYAVKYYGN